MDDQGHVHHVLGGESRLLEKKFSLSQFTDEPAVRAENEALKLTDDIIGDSLDTCLRLMDLGGSL